MVKSAAFDYSQKTRTELSNSILLLNIRMVSSYFLSLFLQNFTFDMKYQRKFSFFWTFWWHLYFMTLTRPPFLMVMRCEERKKEKQERKKLRHLWLNHNFHDYFILKWVTICCCSETVYICINMIYFHHMHDVMCLKPTVQTYQNISQVLPNWLVFFLTNKTPSLQSIRKLSFWNDESININQKLPIFCKHMSFKEDTVTFRPRALPPERKGPSNFCLTITASALSLRWSFCEVEKGGPLSKPCIL